MFSVLVVMFGLFLVIMQIRLKECSDFIILMKIRLMSGVFNIGRVMQEYICQVCVWFSCVVFSGLGGRVFSSFRMIMVKNNFYCQILIVVIVQSVSSGFDRKVVLWMFISFSSQFRMLVSGEYMNFQMKVVDMCGSSIGVISKMYMVCCYLLWMFLNRQMVMRMLVIIVFSMVIIFQIVEILMVLRKCWFDSSCLILCSQMQLLLGQCSMWFFSVRLIVVIVGISFSISIISSDGLRNRQGSEVFL